MLREDQVVSGFFSKFRLEPFVVILEYHIHLLQVKG